MPSKLGVTYQMSHHAGGGRTEVSNQITAINSLGMPDYRVGASFDMQLNPYFTSGLTYMFSEDYSAANNGGTGKSNNIFGVRMGLNF